MDWSGLKWVGVAWSGLEHNSIKPVFKDIVYSRCQVQNRMTIPRKGFEENYTKQKC